MIKIFRSLLIILFIASYTLPANSETSWITKKDKTKKTLVKKTEKKSEKNEWIKKKKKEKVKKNKKKFKEKIKESKSWITKKSKEKIKKIKKDLTKYKEVKSLPKAELYFAAIIEPKEENEEAVYLYGYLNSDKKSSQSKKFKFANNNFYSLNDGIVYFDDKKTTCTIDAQKGVMFGDLIGKLIIKCNKKEVLEAAINFSKNGKTGNANGIYKNGSDVKFEFYTSKNDAIAKLDIYKKDIETLIARSLPAAGNNKKIALEPNGKYYALLIGNSTYTKWASLTSPVIDVNQIETLLKNKYNFEKVIKVKNGTREEIFDSFDQLSELTTDNDYVLVYYSGHGDQKGNKSYWIPTDAKKKYSSKWINIKDIENYLEEIPAHHLAIMVDSCYFTGFKGSNKIDEKKSKHYKKFLDKRARIVLASGQNEPVSDTGAGKNSVFGKTLIQSLENSEGAISLGEIGLSIGYAHANMDQMPIYATYNHWGHGGGDFVFIPKKKSK